MKTKIVFICLFLFIISALISCSDESPVENITEYPEGISGSTSFNYEFLSTAPVHTQTSMLSGYENKLYRYGSNSPVQVLDLQTSGWSQIQLPESSFRRWDGAAITVGNMIYIVAVSSEQNSYDILKLDPISSTFTHTGILLPEFFHYPAYCIENDNIVFFSMKTDSVYQYNTSRNELSKIADNPFFISSYDNMSLSSGKYGDYFYVFGGISNQERNLFYRLDLTTYTWQELEIPELLRTKYLFGSGFGQQFVLFADSSFVYEYSFTNEKWYQSTDDVPIYPATLQGTPEYSTEWSFYADGESLFATEIFNDKVWKISK